MALTPAGSDALPPDTSFTAAPPDGAAPSDGGAPNGTALGGVGGSGELLAFDWASDEGRFVNELDRDVFVLTDRYDAAGQAEGIVAVRVPPGGTGRGDAVLIDDGDGRIGDDDRAFKVPNSRNADQGWTVQENRRGDVEVVSQTEGTSLIGGLAELRKPFSNDYGGMSLDHFQRIMGDKPIVDEQTGDVLRPAPGPRRGLFGP